MAATTALELGGNHTFVRVISGESTSRDDVYSCMYQCSPTAGVMDRGGCFYSGCPPGSSQQAEDICFGGAGSGVYSVDFLQIGDESACSKLVDASTRFTYSQRSESYAQFYQKEGDDSNSPNAKAMVKNNTNASALSAAMVVKSNMNASALVPANGFFDFLLELKKWVKDRLLLPVAIVL